jgi:phosphoglucomutase
VHFWQRIAEVYALDLEVVSDAVDPTFRFMTLDWDGKIRMDPSSIYAMQRLVGLKDKYDIAFGCDTDHDRHGVVAPSTGLMQPNSYLATMVDYLFRHRDGWRKNAAVGKTVVSSVMIDRVAQRLGRPLYETPTGFKWFVDGLYNGALGFGGEESAGASFLRIDGLPWSTDKDGIAPALLSAEITARSGKDPGAVFADISSDLGATYADRIDAPATAQQKQRLGKLDASQVKAQQLAGDPIERILTAAPANGAAIGGLKVVSRGGWFAARPSGTESIYKIYAESFHDKDHLQRLIAEAQSVVNAALTG